MKAQYIEIIVTVADSGSIGAAAQRLGKSQPAITSALRKAEAELGEQIFHRVPHGVVPTDFGQMIIERCRRVWSEMRRLDDDVAQRKGDMVGRVNVIAATSVASVRVLPTALKQYRRKYPSIRINVSAGRMSQGFQSVISGEADFVVGPMPDPKFAGGLTSVPLMEAHIVVVTGANSKYRDVSDAETLKSAKWLVNGPVENRPRYSQFFEARGIEPPEPVLSVESTVSILAMIEDSDDLCCISREVLDHMRGTAKIAVLPLEDEIGRSTIALSYSRDRPLTLAALRFSDIVCQNAELP